MTTSEEPSRYAVCRVGEEFSVEDRRTGERLASFHTWKAAETFAKKLRRTMTAPKENTNSNLS